MVDERCGRRLTIRTCDTDHLRVRVSACKLNLADDVRTLINQFFDHWGTVRNAWTLDNLVCIQDFLFCMLSFLPLNSVVVKHLLILILDGRHVANKHVEPFLLCQYSRAGTTFSCS